MENFSEAMSPDDIHVVEVSGGDAASDKIAALFADKLKPRLDVVEQVRADLSEERIEVPGVVVVGDQSAGKSSVLESISGINFPRKENTCTRRPCCVRMRCDPRLRKPFARVSNQADLEDSDKLDLCEIGGKINELTEELGGEGSTIHDEPIHVEVVKPVGPTCTLIDLPGITHVVKGQDDAHDVIVNMIRTHIKSEQIIILAVVCATADFGNCEALKLAEEVDPEGQRTIGVVTKVDTVPADSDIVQKIRCERENDIHLKLGWIAVRCRTPTEVKDGVDATKLLHQEKQLFKTHSLLSQLESHQWGIQTLVERVVTIQGATVEKWLPEVRAKLRRLIADKQRELRKLPEAVRDDSDRRRRIHHIIQGMVDDFRAILLGNYPAHWRKDKDIHVAPRMYERYTHFKEEVEGKTTDFLSQEMSEKVEDADSENKGTSLPNFLSTPVFRQIFLEELEEAFDEPLEDVVRACQELMEQVMGKLSEHHAKEFPKIVTFLLGETKDLVQQQAELGAEKCRDMMSMQAHIFTQNEADYVDCVKKVEKQIEECEGDRNRFQEFLGTLFGSTGQLAGASQNRKQKWEKAFELAELQRTKPRVFQMQTSLQAYTDMVHNRLLDGIPQMLHMQLVDLLNQQLPMLFERACKRAGPGGEQQLLEAYLQEDVGVRNARGQLEVSLRRLIASEEKLKNI